MVDSPTPIVPISSDSTRVMSSSGAELLDQRGRGDPAGGAAAGDDDALHGLRVQACSPGVGQRLSRLSRLARSRRALSLVERREVAAGAPRAGARPRGRQDRRRNSRTARATPRFSGSGRSRRLSSACSRVFCGVSMKAGDGVPPVVDHDVEGVERLDLVPPQRRVEEHVARLQFGHLAGGERVGGSAGSGRDRARAKSTMLTTWPPGVGSSGPG